MNSPVCKIDFDMYHQQILEGNLIPNIDLAWEEICYFQIGDHPGRNEPTTGEINYRNIFCHLHAKGYAGYSAWSTGTRSLGSRESTQSSMPTSPATRTASDSDLKHPLPFRVLDLRKSRLEIRRSMPRSHGRWWHQRPLGRVLLPQDSGRTQIAGARQRFRDAHDTRQHVLRCACRTRSVRGRGAAVTAKRRRNKNSQFRG